MKKELFTAEQLVSHMKAKGITFKYDTEDDVCRYLNYNNNYFKLSSYRKNYSKRKTMDGGEQYINLDFAYLKDLAIIDMNLRYTILQMSLDIEHHTKLEILRIIGEYETDCYEVVRDYVSSLSDKAKHILEEDIKKSQNSIYARDIFDKYDADYPVWAFLEIIPLGRLLNFYNFCADRYNNAKMKDNYYRLKTCKELRNASAHSNCILNDLHSGKVTHSTNAAVTHALMRINGVKRNARIRKMKIARIQQIVTFLYVYTDVVKSSGIQDSATEKLACLVARMNEHLDYYETNDMIYSSFVFLETVIDNWFLTKNNKTSIILTT